MSRARTAALTAAALTLSLPLAAAPATARPHYDHGRAGQVSHGHGAHAPAAFPSTIALPDGFQPEGISSGLGSLYVGSIPTGAIYRADPRTGAGEVLVAGREGRAAIGTEVAGRRLWVAGGPTGQAFIYDAKTGRDVAAATLTDGPAFINDLAVVGRTGWFTNSAAPELYAVTLGKGGRTTVRTLPITGDLQYDDDPSTFEANGIVALRGGRELLVVQSRTGKLFRIDAATGSSTEVPLAGGDLVNGDGMLLVGRSLYVVKNRSNEIAVVRLDGSARTGAVVKTIADSDFRVPTTVALSRGSLYAVNARFGTTPAPDTDYDIVRVDGR